MLTHLPTLSRRDAVKAAAWALAAAAIAPKLAFADEKAVAAEIKKLYGDKPMASGKIKLDVPEIAENGLVVPINIEIESPMTEADYVKTVHVFAEGNPLVPCVNSALETLRSNGTLQELEDTYLTQEGGIPTITE